MENKISTVFFAILVIIFWVQSTDAQSVVLEVTLPNFTSSSPLLVGLYDAIQERVDRENDLIEQILDSVDDFLDVVTIPGLRNLVIDYINYLVEWENEALRVIVEDATRIAEAINVAGVELDENLKEVVSGALESLLKCKNIVETSLMKTLGLIRGLLDEFNACTNILCKSGVIAKVSGVVDEIVADNQTAYRNCRDTIVQGIANASNGLQEALATFLNQSG